MTNERRKWPRREVDVPALLHAEGRTLTARLRDICRDAALLESDTLLDLGTAVGLDVTLPGLSSPMTLQGRVIRTAAGDVQAHALAVLFDDVPVGDAMRIDFFVALYENERGAQTSPSAAAGSR